MSKIDFSNPGKTVREMEWHEFTDMIREEGYVCEGWQTYPTQEQKEKGKYVQFYWGRSCMTICVSEINKSYTTVDSGD